MEVGGHCHCLHVSLGFFLENHPKIPLNQYRYFGVVYHVYSVCITLLKVVSYHDLRVLSMSVMGFQKKVLMIGELYPSSFVIFWNFFNFAKPLSEHCNVT